jgi:hypothetical protein
MSFDIFFQSCRFAQATIQVPNAHTGKMEEVLPSEPPSEAERMAVREVLAKAAVSPLNKSGCATVRFADGGSAEIFADEIERSCMVAVRGLTADVIGFLFDLLKARNWAILPAMDDVGAVAFSPDAFHHLPDNFPSTMICQSSAELGILLKEGFEKFKAYRDQINRASPKS